MKTIPSPPLTSRFSGALLTALLLAPPALAEPVVLEHEPVGFPRPQRPGRIHARIPWGSVTVVGEETDVVRATARVSGLDDPGEVARQGPVAGRAAIAVDAVGDDLVVRVPVDVEGFHSVDLELRVPARADLALTVERGGEIAVEGVRGALEIENRNGSVALRAVSGQALVDCRNGAVTASFVDVEPDAPMSFASLNGSLDLTFPADLRADVHARVRRGTIESDFELTGSPASVAAAAWPDDRAVLAGQAPRVRSGSIGGGGPDYYFFTANGSVLLRRGGEAASVDR